MRIETSVTAISWIPSEAVTMASFKAPFEIGISHYDDPLPDHIDNLTALRDADKFRFANVLRAWVDVSDAGKILGYGYSGGSMIGSTTLRVGKKEMTFGAHPYPDIQRDPVVTDTSVTFVQTGGGSTGVPAPRRVAKPPFVQWEAPTAWSTLSLTINADGTSKGELVGASPFPRHWIYDDNNDLIAKTGMIDFKEWFRHAFDKHTPWGDEDSPAFVTTVETALERELSKRLMRDGAKPKYKKLKEGENLVEQGDKGEEMFLLLDGVLEAVVDGEVVGDLGPGALLGERALIETGLRTATLRAATKVRVAVVDASVAAPELLAELAEGHKREDNTA
ncbi:MAG TPA: cyclic nucleotide-binding domain-containing protein [Acidimicrobiales bacterium]|nr:cyclic nucleotide-binding domain-containing protein [Acidimicrobiales bacterium]